MTFVLYELLIDVRHYFVCSLLIAEEWISCNCVLIHWVESPLLLNQLYGRWGRTSHLSFYDVSISKLTGWALHWRKQTVYWAALLLERMTGSLPFKIVEQYSTVIVEVKNSLQIKKVAMIFPGRNVVLAFRDVVIRCRDCRFIRLDSRVKKCTCLFSVTLQKLCGFICVQASEDWLTYLALNFTWPNTYFECLNSIFDGDSSNASNKTINISQLVEALGWRASDSFSTLNRPSLNDCTNHKSELIEALASELILINLRRSDTIMLS